MNAWLRCGRRLEAETGWDVQNIGYPSRSQPLECLADGIAAEIQQHVSKNSSVFVVSHSLGGILWRILQGRPGNDTRWAGIVQIGGPAVHVTVTWLSIALLTDA